MQVQHRGLMWYLECYIDDGGDNDDGLFPVNTYIHEDFLEIYKDIKNIFTNPKSGIKLAVLFHLPSSREWNLFSLEDVREKIGHLVPFA